MVTKYLSFAFYDPDIVFTNAVNVFALDSDAAFCVLQSSIHFVWVELNKSTLEDRLRYNPSDCFETFPFPESWQSDSRLEAAGKAYYEYRAQLMVKNDDGLTKTYNYFHDSDERDSGIIKLRELHSAMDRAVLDAYGWKNIPTDYEFLLDFEIDEEEWSPRKKKPYRYRWPDEVRDEVLARLLELNAERAKEEARSGLSAKKSNAKKTRAKKKRVQQGNTGQKELF